MKGKVARVCDDCFVVLKQAVVEAGAPVML